MNVLFVFAHPDDEAFGPAGTIAKHAAMGDTVTVMSLCKGNRPGSEYVSDQRQAAFKKSCKVLGATPVIKDSSDVFLDFHVATETISHMIEEVKPVIVYTHNISDLHRDHRTTAEACLVACRPKPESTVDKLFYCEIAASTDWTFGQMAPVFSPNTFIDVSDFIYKKSQVMDFYETETYEFPDARSTHAMKVNALNRGRQVGVEYAEAFTLVFSRDRKTL